MPSGYTHKVLKGASAKEFATECARAFGALIDLRDEPSNTPIPKQLEDRDSARYQAQIEKSEKRLKHVKKMSFARAAKHAQNDYNNERNYHVQALAETAENCFKLSKVMAEVATYTPPTKDHVNYKNFMLSQLSDTIDFDGNPDYHTKALENLELLTPQEWKKEQAERATKEIAYNKKLLAEHQERHNDRNQWLQDLHTSLDHFSK